MILIPIVLVAAGLGTIAYLATGDFDRPVPDHEPDAPAVADSTGYKLVDAILSELRKAAESSGIPLGLLVGWIAKESGGRLADTTKYDERGYFQLMPDESKRLGLDHQRLSTDSVYSINGGLLLIGLYMKAVEALGVAKPGSAYFWKLVKLAHSMGSGAMKQVVQAAQAVGDASTWSALEQYAEDHDAEMLHLTKHSPAKWFPFVDKVYAVGAPFGFGDVTVVGGEVFSDIVDPLDCLQAA